MNCHRQTEGVRFAVAEANCPAERHPGVRGFAFA
jgi:hypothetical protein